MSGGQDEAAGVIGTSGGPAALPTGPVYCAVCQHSAKVKGCSGCGGPTGSAQWPPCQRCRAVLVQAVDAPPAPSLPS